VGFEDGWTCLAGIAPCPPNSPQSPRPVAVLRRLLAPEAPHSQSDAVLEALVEEALQSLGGIDASGSEGFAFEPSGRLRRVRIRRSETIHRKCPWKPPSFSRRASPERIGPRWESRRQGRSANLSGDARVTFRGAECSGRVLDVSSAGMMLESPIAPEIGEAITVQHQGGATLRYFVRWALEERFGLGCCEQDVIWDGHRAPWWDDGTIAT
jgi:hypothetical protein